MRRLQIAKTFFDPEQYTGRGIKFRDRTQAPFENVVDCLSQKLRLYASVRVKLYEEDPSKAYFKQIDYEVLSVPLWEQLKERRALQDRSSASMRR